MGWGGYGEYAGNEIYNSARTEAYAKSANAYWFKGCYDDEWLPLMLGDGANYTTPLQDNAPWVDEDAPESFDFWGAYPIDISGIEDSSRTSTVNESTLDGGIPGRIRHATKSVVFSVALLGATECAVDYGMRWLRRALLPGPCDGTLSVATCLGDDFCYLNCAPCMDPDPADGPLDPEDCLDPFRRTLKKFAIISGPSVTSKRIMSDGCATMWTVTFTGVAGTPWEYGAEIPIIEDFMKPGVTNPYVSDVVGVATLNGTVTSDAGCAQQVWTPFVDPLCPALVAPPEPPTIPLGCYVPPANWLRRQATIPPEYIPLWDSVVPTVSISATSQDLRNLRLRFYANTFNTPTVQDNCAYCGDIVVSYVPAGHTLILDGVNERVYMMAPGGVQRRADSLVFATDGTPFTWPQLSCGSGYIVTFDLPQTTKVNPVVDLSLTPRSV